MDGSASISTAPASSSSTSTVTVATTPTPAAVSVTATDSSLASSSCCAVTVTVFAVFQFVGLKPTVARDTVAAPVSLLATVSVVFAAGALCRTTVKLPSLALVAPPSSFSERLPGDTVASTDAADTGAMGVVRAPRWACADAGTVTDSVAAASKSVPSWASASSAVVRSGVTAASEAMVRPGTVVFKMKLDRVTPLVNVVSPSVTWATAPSRFPSVSVAGVVASAALGSKMVIANVSVSRSAAVRLVSASWAWTVTVAAPGVRRVGVPHTVRAAQFGAPRESPCGRLMAEYETVPSPPLAAGIWNVWIGTLVWKTLSGTEPLPKAGAAPGCRATCRATSWPPNFSAGHWCWLPKSQASSSASAALPVVPSSSTSWSSQVA